jgi:hypothetical protein
VTCTLCDTVICGEIKRLKQHLAGGYADTKMCLKTTEIRKGMRDYLQKNKRKRPFFIHDDKQEEDSDGVVLVDL